MLDSGTGVPSTSGPWARSPKAGFFVGAFIVCLWTVNVVHDLAYIKVALLIVNLYVYCFYKHIEYVMGGGIVLTITR